VIKKIKTSDIIAIVSVIGIIGWIISDFFGGMIPYLISYSFIIIPIIIIYLISFIKTIISLIKKGFHQNKINVISHSILFLSILIFNVYDSEIFKSRKIMSAVLKDDLYHYRLVFRENGTVENQINGFLGFSETKYGEYKFKDSLIVFSIKPYDNNFIPDTLLVDKKQNAIFLNKNKDGQFSTKKDWLNYFEIER
jgi:hypothetical protein